MSKWQASRIISTYSADTFGVCSALFELGGMTVMHDASGCNSTYSTHDEPRWYDMDSMVYISALSEMEAIMGDDEKLVNDIATAAEELHPAFIAICGTPIPTMTGFDFKAVAELIEARTGIPTMGFPTTGMNTYVHGASMALAEVARRFVEAPARNDRKASTAERSALTTKPDADDGAGCPDLPAAVEGPRVNILGLTPLDFSVCGADRSIAAWLEDEGFTVASRWAMGCTREELKGAAAADVNLVVSAAGLGAAAVLNERFGIPYVVGLPLGKTARSELAKMLRDTAGAPGAGGSGTAAVAADTAAYAADGAPVIIIGEGITSLALATAIENECGSCDSGKGEPQTHVICATECPEGILRACDCMAHDEDDIIEAIREITRTGRAAGAEPDRAVIIADPLYKPICPDGAAFIALPSEAFSGRIWRDEIPDLIADPDAILDKVRAAL